MSSIGRAEDRHCGPREACVSDRIAATVIICDGNIRERRRDPAILSAPSIPSRPWPPPARLKAASPAGVARKKLVHVDTLPQPYSGRVPSTAGAVPRLVRAILQRLGQPHRTDFLLA